ncbi:MAG: glycosyltransferase family 1 protein [Rikenellaceae bacterium]
MIIGIDYRLAASSHRGMGRYCREIVDKLFKIDSINKYILYIDTDCDKKLPENFRWHKLPTTNYILGEQLALPLMMRRDKIDVMWSTSNTFPIFISSKIKLVVTVHDLIFMYALPKGQNFTQRIGALYRRWVMKLSHRRVDKYITVSHFSAHELARIFHISDSVITYNCIESFFKKAATHKPTRFADKFYFTLSADAPSKNMNFLLDAFKYKLPDKKLIVAGIKDKSPLRNEYTTSNITFLKDGVSDSTLLDHFMMCEAFIYVSLQEGFGIPPLEALACGAKVICSNATSLPEVIGENGILINPKDEKSLINAIDQIKSFKISPDDLDSHLQQFTDWKIPAQIVHNILCK